MPQNTTIKSGLRIVRDAAALRQRDGATARCTNRHGCTEGVEVIAVGTRLRRDDGGARIAAFTRFLAEETVFYGRRAARSTGQLLTTGALPAAGRAGRGGPGWKCRCPAPARWR